MTIFPKKYFNQFFRYDYIVKTSNLFLHIVSVGVDRHKHRRVRQYTHECDYFSRRLK